MIPRTTGLRLGSATFIGLLLAAASHREPKLEALKSPAKAGAGEPSLATGADGRVYMSWIEPADTGNAVRVASFDGTVWSAPHTVHAGADVLVNWADFPSIEAIDGKRLAVHWIQRAGRSTGIRVSQSPDGGARWGAPATPYRDTTMQEYGFGTMWSEQGSVHVAWLDGRKFAVRGADHAMMLVSTTVDAKGKVGAETVVDDRICDCCQNAAAVTSRGPIVAYRNRTADEIRDVYVARRVDGKWTEGKPVASDNWKINACPVNGPAIAARGVDVAVAWFTAANDSARVKLAFSRDAGATFAAPLRIDDGNPTGRVDVALLADKSALVTWIERTGGDSATIRAKRVTRDGKVSPAFTVAASSSARASGFPRMTATPKHVYFAWTVPGRPAEVRVARVAIASLE